MDDTTELPTVEEGRASVFLPPSVFYNPVQEFNRDLTIAVITEYSRSYLLHKETDHEKPTDSEILPASDVSDTNDRNVDAEGSTEDPAAKLATPVDKAPADDARKKRGLRILEALAASGLRSVRFALEIPGISEVIANDYDKTAVQYIRRNVDYNNVGHLVTPSCSDASMVMYNSRRRSNRFSVVDLDPYGSPAPFLDAAVQCVADGGLLCVTCTDMAVLCGNASETCYAKYGAVSLRVPYCHEMALRILLQSIASHAARYQRYIEPLLCMSADFYVRVFVRLHTGQSRVKDVPTHLSYVYQCRSCGSFKLQPLMTKSEHIYSVASGPPVAPNCEHCGGRHAIAGPIWSAPIHNIDFVGRVCKAVSDDSTLFPSTRDRIRGVLNVICEELVDQPLYYVGDAVCGVLHCSSPGFIPIRSALLHAGYKVSLSHANKSSVKTNAPTHVIWDIFRCWVRKHPVSENRLHEGSAAQRILSNQPTLEANFLPHPDANPKSRALGLLRWQLNPEKNWGPKARATRSGNHETVVDRRQKGTEKANKSRAKRKACVDLKKFPCKKYRIGCCDLGGKCKYMHEDVDKLSDKDQDVDRDVNVEHSAVEGDETARTATSESCI